MHIEIQKCMERCPDYLDFPTAWAIQRYALSVEDHDPRCSSVPSEVDIMRGPHFLCDCFAVRTEWQRLRKSRRTEDAESVGRVQVVLYPGELTAVEKLLSFMLGRKHPDALRKSLQKNFTEKEWSDLQDAWCRVIEPAVKNQEAQCQVTTSESGK